MSSPQQETLNTFFSKRPLLSLPFISATKVLCTYVNFTQTDIFNSEALLLAIFEHSYNLTPPFKYFIYIVPFLKSMYHYCCTINIKIWIWWYKRGMSPYYIWRYQLNIFLSFPLINLYLQFVFNVKLICLNIILYFFMISVRKFCLKCVSNIFAIVFVIDQL